jgi:hypothetical protein
MRGHSESRILGFQVESDLSAKIYHAVKHGTGDGLVVAAGAGEGFGVLMNAAKGTATVKGGAEVALQGGGAKAKLAGVVSRGDSLTSDANGAFVAAGAGERCLAIAMESGVSGDVIAVELDLHSTL